MRDLAASTTSCPHTALKTSGPYLFCKNRINSEEGASKPHRPAVEYR